MQELVEDLRASREGLRDFANAMRTNERLWAVKYMGPCALDPALRSVQLVQRLSQVLEKCNVPKALEAFGYRRMGRTLRYWLDPEAGYPDLKGDEIDLSELFPDLFNHLLLTYDVIPRARRSAEARKRRLDKMAPATAFQSEMRAINREKRMREMEEEEVTKRLREESVSGCGA